MVSKKATTIDEIDAAVQYRVPVEPDNIFFTDLSKARGSFKESRLLRSLRLDAKKPYKLVENTENKKLIFLAGRYGSGKSSELKRIALEIENPQSYLCIKCDLDKDLDMNNIDFVDILIFMAESLSKRMEQKKISIDTDVIASLNSWFTERIKETNQNAEYSAGIDTKISAKAGLLGFIKIMGSLKTAFKYNSSYAEKARMIFRNNFSDLKDKFNEFIGEAILQMEKKKIAKDILFIIDGIEKVQTEELRKRIIIDDGLRIREIKANMLITMPIELHHQVSALRTMEPEIIRFPFIKLADKETGAPIKENIKILKEYIYKRVDKALFENEKLVEDIIATSGGSPRELLRIIEIMVRELEPEEIVLNKKAFKDAVKYLGNLYATGITQEEFDLINEVVNSNGEIPFSKTLQGLLARVIIMEYNDGTYKKINPIIEASDIYKKYVN